ncbi:dipeptide ABC transporter ATP-binding protein [Promicromonospora thailandica]|uniref:Peptide/nickel transport system ATP-binding protein n=1 Tax=Promicromonospora thailandica TaxID=765201 RepID=A0A9X2FYG6_9MICO|nr:ABC transporter ATP-binding protein [Promicromonospora thailandica]MCP2262865.1 peptide/nickel transport system ATP-binding protein [Promicromonospora thailandica]
MSEPVLRIRDLAVSFGGRRVVDGVSLEVAAGECVAIVGESGSGKSVSARSVLGLAGEGARVTATELTVAGEPVLGLPGRRLRRLRGGTVGFIAQDALVSLDPLRPVGREIGDTLALHTDLGAAARRERTLELLRRVGLDDPELRARQRPGQLSGGQRQRALIAAGIAGEPRLVIADEPTTALDQPVQAGVLRLLGELRDEGTGVLLISHDLSVVRGVADRVLVMTDGVLVEEGTPAEVFEHPHHPYTKALVAAVPAGRPRGTRLSAPPTDSAAERRDDRSSGAGTPTTPTLDDPATGVLMEVHGVRRVFHVGARDIVAADDVSFTLRARRTLGLVGESGSGKSTTARILLGLEPPDAGAVTLLGEPWSPLPEKARRTRRPLVGAVFQDALSSFDPRWTVGAVLADALTRGRTVRPGRVRREITELLGTVGLDPDVADRRPLHLSGGQRQRVSIARALTGDPRVLVLDEPVSALDVSVQAQVLDLLDRLQRERDLAYLLITHDLGVALHMSDEIAVLQEGRIVERGPASSVFADPQHPYARRLRDAVRP